MIRISGVIRESIVDGPGIRFVVFTQGCTHNCEGCHNPSTHSINGGYLIDSDKIITEFSKNPLLKGITLSGGEPFLQPSELVPLARAVKNMGKDVVIYSGFTYEELVKKAQTDKATEELMSLCDILVDGRFVLSQRDLTLVFRGSRNQRLIDMNKTREKSELILLNI